MEVYRSKDGHVAKYIHDDGSETAIKTTPIQEYGGVYGKVTNKYNVFISIAVGCVIGCKFCYLTTKKCPCANLAEEEIINNVIDAIRTEIDHKPELKDMYTKLSWMGMSDAYIDTRKMYKVSMGIGDILESEALSAGIDGIDISTTLPRLPSSGSDYISALAHSINGFKLNPQRNYYEIGSRHPIRVFYSLHSAIEVARKYLIPKTVPLNLAIPYLIDLVEQDNVTVIIHHMFFQDVNDSEEEVNKLIYFMENFPTTELRLLRFNRCEGTSYRESDKFNKIVEKLLDKGIAIKVQSSPGSTIKAACGQFLLSNIKGVKNEES